MKKDWKIAIIVFVVLAVIALFFLIESTKIETELEDAREASESMKLLEVEKTLRAKFEVEPSLSENLEILTVKGGKDTFQVRISLKFAPASIEEVSTITQSICEVVYYELKSAGLKQSISVYAQRPKPGSPGLVIVYGHTRYSSVTGKFEWHQQK